MRSCLFQSHFSNRFLHKVYCTYIFHTSNNFTDHKMLIYNFFLQLHSTISSFCKRIYYVHLCVILFLFLSKTEVQATNKSCLSGFERLQNQTHLLRFETKLSQIFFFFLLFSELHITFQLYQGICLLEDCVELPFCVITSFNRTRIDFSPQRPLQRNYCREN